MANRSRGASDIVLRSSDLTLGFNLATDRNGVPEVVTTELSPGRLDEQVKNADVPRVYTSLDAGMGFSRKIDQVATGYDYALPGYTRTPGGIFCPAGAVTEIPLPTSGWIPRPISESVLFRDDLHLLVQGQYQLVISLGDDLPSVGSDGGPGFVGRGMAVFGDRLYVAGDVALMYRELGTGAWSLPGAVPRGLLATASWRPQGIPTDVMIANTGRSHITWVPITADPMNPDDWSAPVRVGADDQYGIYRLVAAPRRVFMLRADGAYDMDELGTRGFNIAPWIADGFDPNNGLWGMHVGSGLYYGHAQGLAFIPTEGEAQYRPAWAHPGWGLPWEGPVRGHPVAGTLHDGWTLVAFYDGVNSYICAGRPSEAPYGAATHTWHGAEAVVPDRVTHMKVHNLPGGDTWPRLLIATVKETDATQTRLYWHSLTKTANPLYEIVRGTPFVPAASSSLFLPADDWGQPSAVASLLQVEVTSERLSDSATIRTWAAADAGPYVEQGLADRDPYTKFAPTDLVEGFTLRARVDLAGPAILRALTLRAALGYELREARVYHLILAYDNALKVPGSRENRDPAARLADLRTMLGRVVTLEDEGPMRVRVVQVMAPVRRQVGPAARAGAWALVVPVLVSILDQSFRYDGVDRFDATKTWS